MAVKTIEEARKIVLNKRPGFKVFSEKEYDRCFVISVVPNDHTPSKGIFIGGGTRVDKETGETSLFNPLTEGIRK